MHLHMYRYRHTRLKLVFMLSRGHLSSTTRHIECSRSNVRVGMQLAACAQMACAWGASRAVRARAVRCARSGARPRHGAASLSSLTQATWDAQIVPDSGFHLPGSGAKLITHIKGANHHSGLTRARLGGDLACQPVAPIKAYASQSVRAGGHGHAQGLRRCSWAGMTMR